MSPAPFYARPVSALGDQSNLSTVLSRAGGCPVSRRFSRRDFFITKNVLLIKQICFWRVDIVLTIEHTDFASRETRHGTSLRAEGRGKYQQASRRAAGSNRKLGEPQS